MLVLLNERKEPICHVPKVGLQGFVLVCQFTVLSECQLGALICIEDSMCCPKHSSLKIIHDITMLDCLTSQT